MKNTFLLFGKFSAVGLTGFLIDFVVMLVLNHFTTYILVSRATSWLIAVSSTFILNSIFTFRSGKRDRFTYSLNRYCLYVLSQTSGGLVNVTTYFLMMQIYEAKAYIAFTLGTFLGMAFNFSFAAKVLSRKN